MPTPTERSTEDIDDTTVRLRIDSKHYIEADQIQIDSVWSRRLKIVKSATGEEIPHDEPLFLLRARDIWAEDALRQYLLLCKAEGCSTFHVEGIRTALRQFHAYSQDHGDLMKEPGSSMRRQGVDPNG